MAVLSGSAERIGPWGWWFDAMVILKIDTSIHNAPLMSDRGWEIGIFGQKVADNAFISVLG
jgi:hypothetical protein